MLESHVNTMALCVEIDKGPNKSGVRAAILIVQEALLYAS